MKWSLTVRERIVLLSLLPSEASFVMLKVIRRVREALSFSLDEIHHLAIEQLPDGRISWNAEKAKEWVKEMEISTNVVDLISQKLIALDREQKLQEEHVPIYERFVLGKKS